MFQLLLEAHGLSLDVTSEETALDLDVHCRCASPGCDRINHGRKWNTGSPIHSGRHLASVRHKGELAVELHVGDCEGRNAERYTTPEIYRVDLR